MTTREMWVCPDCGREFANRNQWHSCGKYSVEAALAGSSPEIRAFYMQVIEMVATCGEFEIAAVKTRVLLKVVSVFAALDPKRRWLDLEILLPRQSDNARFRRVVQASASNYGHVLRLESPGDLDAELQEWLCEAYSAREMHHARR